MTPLPTLGGDNGFASGINNQGQVVGVSSLAVDSMRGIHIGLEVNRKTSPHAGAPTIPVPIWSSPLSKAPTLRGFS